MNVVSTSSESNPLAELKRIAVDVEMALLGACLINPEAIDKAAPHVSTVDFTEPFLGSIWDLMRKHHNEGVNLSPLLVITRLSSPEVINNLKNVLQCTPAEFVGRLGACATSVIGASDHAKMIREMGGRRRLFDAGHSLARAAANPSEEIRESASVTSAIIEKVLNGGHKPTLSLTAIMDASINKLRTPNNSRSVTTGLKDLDYLTGGLVSGDLIILGGRPSMGKSALSISMALQSAQHSDRIRSGDAGGEPYSVLFMSHEMTHEQVVERWLTDLSYDYGDRYEPLEYRRFRPSPNAELQMPSAAEAAALDEAYRVLRRLPIAVDGRPGMTVSECTATIRQHKRRAERRGMPLKVVVVDHIGLGKILPDFRDGRGRVDEIGEITSSLKACAVNDDLALVACHQLSRATEGRDNKRPTLADFRDSGHIEQDADVMIGVYRDAYYLERTKHGDSEKEAQRGADLALHQHEMEAAVLKQRSGKVGTASLFAHMGANAIRNMHRDH